MPIEIQLEDNFILDFISDDKRTIALPTIKIIPTPSSRLFIARIGVTVRGSPPDLAAKIQSAYRQIQYSPPMPLSRLFFFPSKTNQCTLERPLSELTTEVDCTLQVTVEYYESNAKGKPNKSLRKHQAKTCLIWWMPLVENELILEDEPPIKSTVINPPKERSLLSKQSPPITEKEDIMTDRKPNPKIDYPGWLAIDFGTSNSTVTLFDKTTLPNILGFPEEQERRLRERLQQWLASPENEALFGTSDWNKFLGAVGNNLAQESIPLAETLKQIELNIRGKEQFRRAVSKKLSEIYSEVFRIPYLRQQNLFPVSLEYASKDRQISSFLEITNFDTPLPVMMGEFAEQHQKETIAQAEKLNWQEIIGQFHHSPKRYLGQDKSFEVTLDDKTETVIGEKIIQGAYNHLIELTENYCKENSELAQDQKFYTAVATYPTVASPLVRRQLKQTIESLGLPDVQTAYDEAVAVAIFYLLREFGGDLNVGIDAFKTRCRAEGEKWSQNVMVVDIGGGTTDIALIEFMLEEKDPFEAGENRGAGGRYYVLTPKVLGSSGHTQLGGELITLKLFHWLKVAISDCLLSAIEDGSLESEPLPNLVIQLDEIFLETGKYISGRLLEAIEKNPETAEAYLSALKAAEKILPTHWKKEPQRLQTFYTLWERAETAKIQLSQGNSEFILTEREISELLTQSGIKHDIKNPDRLKVRLSHQQFENLVTSVIQEALKIAKGLLENRLAETEPNAELDWLILSGQTCNLPQVEAQIYQIFSQSKHFISNPEKINFVPEYSKIATSIGACYAEKLRRLIFDPKESKEELRKGANQIYIDVKNLSYYLPCAFNLRTQTGSTSIFQAGEKLSQITVGEILAKARSRWFGSQLDVGVYRQDFQGGELRNWGNFNGQKLANSLAINEADFRKHIKVQFEVDQELQFKLFICRGKPHYLIKANTPSLNLAEGLSENKLNWKVAVKVERDDSRKLQDGDIAVNVAEAYTVDAPQIIRVLFEEGTALNRDIFHYEDEKGKSGEGLISQPLPSFPKSGKHTFYKFQGDKWKMIGELAKPLTDFDGKYYATLDDRGKLRIHAGEIPYYSSDNFECLRQEGWVYSTELDLQPQDIIQKRDPFSGEQ